MKYNVFKWTRYDGKQVYGVGKSEDVFVRVFEDYDSAVKYSRELSIARTRRSSDILDINNGLLKWLKV